MPIAACRALLQVKISIKECILWRCPFDESAFLSWLQKQVRVQMEVKLATSKKTLV